MDNSELDLEAHRRAALDRGVTPEEADKLVALLAKPKIEYRTTDEGCTIELTAPGHKLAADLKAPLDDMSLSVVITRVVQEYLKRRDGPKN